MKFDENRVREAGMTANMTANTSTNNAQRRHNNPNWPTDSPPKSANPFDETSDVDFNLDDMPRDRQIAYVLARLSEFLQAKNAGYGDSALTPISIFSKHGLGRPGDGIYSRLDEKLQRIANANEITKNDLADVLGYLVLLCIKHRFFSFEDLLDY